MKIIYYVSMLCLSLSIAHSAFAKDVPLNELIDRVLERSELIKSGVFRHIIHVAFNRDVVISDNAELDALEMEYNQRRGNLLLIMRGTEWSVSLDQNSYENPLRIVKENHAAEFLELTVPQYIVSPKTSDISDFDHSSYTFLGAGRIPTPSLRNYIRRNKADARDLGSVTLANGDVVRQIQFTIPKASFSVLREHTVAGLDIWDFDTMLLNIYVMPEKGYVVRRIDECLPDGTIKLRYDSIDFIDRGNGIFFPNLFVRTNVWGKENNPGVHKYEILEASRLNETIPDRYFDRQLPKGTVIRDFRKTPWEFRAIRDGLASELDVLFEEWKEAERRKETEEVPKEAVPDIDSKISEKIQKMPPK